MDNKNGVLYKETQTFSHPLIWLVVLCMTFSSVYFGLPQLFEIASDRAPTTEVIIGSSVFLVIGFILPIILLAIKFKIQVRDDGVYLKMIPFRFSFQKIPLSSIKDCQIYEQKEKEKNKLGLRNAISKKAYSLGGKRGIMLEFQNGESIMIESKHPEKIVQAIKTAGSKNA